MATPIIDYWNKYETPHYQPYTYFLDKKFKNWRHNKYNWEIGSWRLAAYCHMYFHIWWSSAKFNWDDGSRELVKFCHMHIKIWWNPKRFNFDDGGESLVIKCQETKHIWETDYLIWRLKQ